jgi:malate dehydrogenase (oxaloacetate-decarboxylating)
MSYDEKSLKLHEQHRGKIEVCCKVPLVTRDDLSTAYTPGVAAPCLAIKADPDSVYQYTAKGNLIAVVTDGSAVLGLGNIGPRAAMPVMEGKAAIFKAFGNVDAVPICLDTQDTEEIIKAAALLAPGFGGINLEDISSPRCFEIEERLQDMLDIPVFHDDQHGTAIVVCSAVINALRVVKKEPCAVTVTLCGLGAAGTAIIKMLLAIGIKHVVAVDKDGIMSSKPDLDPTRRALLAHINPEGRQGTLADAMKGADVFIGVSAPGIVTPEMVSSMNPGAVVFAMANPTPEIMPDLAKAAGAAVVGTGRSDFPNQVNNSLIFPGLFRGALDARAKRVTQKMKVAAAYAVADLVSQEELGPEHIIVSMFDSRLVPAVSEAVARAWREDQ